jgi:peroxiredoxin
MMKRNVLRFLALILASSAVSRADADETPIGRGVGQPVADFTLKDTSGKPVRLYGFAGKKAAVLIFIGTDCPVGNLYMPRLVELNRTYKDKGVVFVAINSNANETAEKVAAHAKTYSVDFPVLKDLENKVADALLAERTCEALVLDRRAVLRYRGAIDDQYGLGTRKDRPTKSYLVEALDALLADRDVETTATGVVGCPLDRIEPKVANRSIPKIRPAAREIVDALKEKQGDKPVDVGQVTYSGEVAAILQAKCQSCHRPAQAAPFPLLTYDHARRWTASIREVVDDRRMPPWHADPRYGHFENNRSLTARERATLIAWVDQGAPLGDPKAVPAPREFPDGWTAGTPDVVFSMPEPYTVPAQGTVAYQRFRVPTGFTEDKWVRSIEPRPGDRSVVHHIIVFLDDKSGKKRPEHLGGYAPGDLPCVYNEGVAKRIPAGSDLVFQLHYTPTGKIRTDRSSVGFIFAKEPVKHRAITQGIAQMRFEIPPEADNYEVRSSLTFPEDSQLLSFMPHMHLRGKDFKYTVTFPDGRSEVLLSIPAYDFAWQSYYRLDKPMAMPKGTRIDCLAHFDNSANNPANPNPKSPVRWGEQTWEEMMIGYIDYYPDRPADSAPAAADRAQATEKPSENSPAAKDALRALSAAPRSDSPEAKGK